MKHRMDEMGYKESEYNLDNLYDAFLKLADKKGQVFDYDLEALAFIGKQQEEPEHFRLDYFSVQSGSAISPPPPSNWPVAKKSKQKPPTVTVRSMPSIRQLTASLTITSNW
ncbi:hypothetical protein ACLK1U_00410 [Escherichia coli]